MKPVVSEIHSPFTTSEKADGRGEAAGGAQSVFEYIRRRIEQLRAHGKLRTSDAYGSTLRSLMRYRDRRDLTFSMLDSDMIEGYEAYLRRNNVCRNTSSFYIRILRSIYNKAVGDGLAAPANPFANVYTGVDRTAKRAITMAEIRRIKNVDLAGDKSKELARDLFMFSFYTRGMSFIDMAYLRKRDIRAGILTYNRKKTGQQLAVRWEAQMQSIVDRHASAASPYLLPIIERADGTEHLQYATRQRQINRNLKAVARQAGVSAPLTMYVARHSWATIAKSMNIPVGVISEGLGHDSETTTQIYLASIRTGMIDKANSKILRGLR